MGSLLISSKKTFVVNKELEIQDNSLDPEKSRASDGNYIRVAVLSPVSILIKEGTHEYTDADLKVGSFKSTDAEDTIESILKWATIKQFIKRKIIQISTGIVEIDEENETQSVQPVKKTTKPRTPKPAVAPTTFAPAESSEPIDEIDE